MITKDDNCISSDNPLFYQMFYYSESKDFIRSLSTDMSATSDKDWKRRVQLMAKNLLKEME